ncbi:Clp protease N-terminal domain-containing protein [Streptomyces sp. NPDC020422]|uniref:Clp protease N-terminal domain-containing protein n=1 Tax=Streptomyces sp. NPDC020422 TaxID=3365074 RepID=UPI00379B32C4
MRPPVPPDRVPELLGPVAGPVPPRLSANRRAELADGLTVELVTAVQGARRRARRDGDRQIDTAHLLHSLIEADPEAGAAFESPGQRARVLGYLVQRPIGYGLRWQRSVEDTGSDLPVLRVEGTDSGLPVLRDERAVPELPVLRGEDTGSDLPVLRVEGTDSGLPVLRDERAVPDLPVPLGDAGLPGLPVPRRGAGAAVGWSPAAAGALAGAFERAALRGDRRVRGLDLLAALAADPGNRAAEVLQSAGVDPRDLVDRLGEPSQQV